MTEECTRYLKLNTEHVLESDVPLARIITETHPEIPPLLLQSTLGIVSSLLPHMTDDPEQVKMLLRGGTFRSFYYGNTIYDNYFYDIWNSQNTPKNAGGLAGAVIRHMSGPMDIDIRLNEKDVRIDENHVVRPRDEKIPSIIACYLNDTGWQKKNTLPEDGVLFEAQRDDYIAQIISVPIGKTEKRPLHNVVFKRVDDGSTILELSMADVARTKVEEDEDIRHLNDGLSADNILVGEILQLQDQLQVRGFFREKEEGWEEVALKEAVAKGKVGPHDGYITHFAESAVEGVRAITLFIAHWASSLRYLGDYSLEEIIHFAGHKKNNMYTGKPSYKRAFARTLIRKQLESASKGQKKNIEELIVPLLSDRLFLVSANPYLGILLSYAYGLLDTMNLGKIINSEKRLKRFLGNIAKKTGFPQDKTWGKHDMLTLVNWYFAACLDGTVDPLVLLDALESLDIPKIEAEELHKIGLHPNDVPRTVESLLLYLLPIGLSFN